MRNSSDQHSSHAPIFGVIGAAAAVLFLVMAAERSGLPIQWSEFFVRITFFLALLAAAWFGRSAAERFFFGYAPAALAQGHGLVVGAIVFVATSLLPGAEQAELWLSKILGSLLGLLAAHSLLKRQHRNSSTVKNDSSPLAQSTTTMAVMRSSVGVALFVFGLFIAIPSSLNALAEISPALNASQNGALGYILILAILAVALGGARGTITMAGMLIFLAMGGMFMALAIGLHASSTLPLPWFENTTTLQAVSELKNNLGLPKMLILRQWPGLGSILNLDCLIMLVLSTVIGAAVAMTLAPAIEVRRRRITWTASVTLIALPLVIIALNSYAIEAVAEQFLGSSVNNPPSGLLEASRLGLLKICGAYLETADAMRIQCGVTPRDTAQIDFARLQIQPNFLFGGLPVALGFTSVITQAVRIVPVALSLAGLLIGVWFMALGLGRYLLGRKQDRPGLASQRIALTRMSAVLAALSIAVLVQFEMTFSTAFHAVLGGVSAAVIILIHFSMAISSKRAPLQTPQAA